MKALAAIALLLLATVAHADLAERCCSKLGLGCPTPTSTTPWITPTPDTSGCRSMAVNTSAREYTTGFTIPSSDKEDCWVFSVPNTGALVQIDAQNTSNTTCGSFAMRVVRPDGTAPPGSPSLGAQPGVPSYTQPGKWRVLLSTRQPCGSYGLIVRARY